MKKRETNRSLGHHLYLALLIFLNLLNLADAYFTHIGVESGYLLELNPIMAYLLDSGQHIAFYASKIFLVLLGSLILFFKSERLFARIVIWLAVLIYVGICVLHFSYIVMLL